MRLDALTPVTVDDLMKRPLTTPAVGVGECQLTVEITTPDSKSAYSEIPDSLPIRPRGPAFEQGIAHGVLQKVLWATDRRYIGPVLIRGMQVDGATRVLMASETGPVGEPVRYVESEGQRWPLYAALAWPAVPEGTARGWPSHTYVERAGCYVYQVDGVDFTERIVFAAR